MSSPTVTLVIPADMAQQLLMVVDMLTGHQPLNRHNMRTIVMLGDSLEEGLQRLVQERKQSAAQPETLPVPAPASPEKNE